MSGFGYSDWSYDQFEKMVIFPPDPLALLHHGGLFLETFSSNSTSYIIDNRSDRSLIDDIIL